MSAFGQTGPYQLPMRTFSMEVAEGTDTLADGSTGVRRGRPVSMYTASGGMLAHPGGLTDQLCLGTLLTDTRNGEVGTIAIDGDFEILTGAAVTAGQYVTVPTDGVMLWIAGDTPALGYYLDDADGSGGDGPVLVRARFVAASTTPGVSGGG